MDSWGKMVKCLTDRTPPQQFIALHGYLWTQTEPVELHQPKGPDKLQQNSFRELDIQF